MLLIYSRYKTIIVPVACFLFPWTDLKEKSLTLQVLGLILQKEIFKP